MEMEWWYSRNLIGQPPLLLLEWEPTPLLVGPPLSAHLLLFSSQAAAG